LLKNICVFCGSSSGRQKIYQEKAVELGEEIVRRRMGLVYGGASIGIMGVLADAVLGGGGEVVGVIPKAIEGREVIHSKLSKLHVVPTMHDRKGLMYDKSDAFIALPGGFGTLDEFIEVTTWAQLGLHHKPIALLNVAGYFDPLVTFFERMGKEEFAHPEYGEFFLVEADPKRLLDRLETFAPRAQTTWITREEI